MDSEKNLVLRKIKRYIKELEKHNIRIGKVYLYGSYAKNNYHQDSDIDIVVISKDFQGIRFLDRRKIVPLRRKIDIRIEPMPYKPENFNEGDPLAVEVMATGEEVKL